MAFTVLHLSDEIQVNSEGVDYQGKPSVSALTGGRWIVAWDGVGPNGRGVYQQVYNADGTPVFLESEGPVERRVNITPSTSTANGYDRYSSVAALDDGGWLVTWTRNVSGSDEEIFVQRFDRDGNPTLRSNGTEVDIRVNTSSIGQQQYSKVTTLEDGGWVVTWVDTYLRGIFQQKYDALGQPQGTNKRLNAPSTSALLSAQDVATIRLADNTEGTVVVWAQRSNNSATPQLFLQIADASGNPIIADRLIGNASTENQIPQIKAL